MQNGNFRTNDTKEKLSEEEIYHLFLKTIIGSRIYLLWVGLMLIVNSFTIWTHRLIELSTITHVSHFSPLLIAGVLSKVGNKRELNQSFPRRHNQIPPLSGTHLSFGFLPWDLILPGNSWKLKQIQTTAKNNAPPGTH